MYITDTGLINLILAIFRYAAQDIKYGSSENREDALNFLNSWWFKELCDVFGPDINIDNIKKMIIKNHVSWRDRYE